MFKLSLDSVSSMATFPKYKINQIDLYELIIQNDRRKKGFEKIFWEEKHYVCLWFYTTWF